MWLLAAGAAAGDPNLRAGRQRGPAVKDEGWCGGAGGGAAAAGGAAPCASGGAPSPLLLPFLFERAARTVAL